MGYRFAAAAALLFACLGTPALAEIEPGTVVPGVVCEASPEYSYALYVPSGYSDEHSWPLILAFDPAGTGSRPVEILRQAAEELGYVVAGSNDSRNFAVWADNLTAAAAVWRDVSDRFAIDAARVYTAGFSGGARVATEVALQTNAVAGAFVHGGGFRERDAVDGEITFAIVGAAGTRDMNYLEVESTHRELVKRGLPSRHLVFEGDHQWAPPEIARRGLLWFDTQAHRLASRTSEPAPLAVLFEQAVARARLIEDEGDHYGAWLEYAQVARDFDGLVEIDSVRAETARLAAHPRALHGSKERARMRRIEERERKKLANAIRRVEASIGDVSVRNSAMRGLSYSIAEIARDERSDDRARADVAHRLRGFVSSVGFEWSVRARREGNLTLAVAFMEVAVQADHSNPEAHLALATAHARRGNRFGTIESLRNAVSLGFTDAARLRESGAFDGLRDDPEFKSIVDSIDEASGR